MMIKVDEYVCHTFEDWLDITKKDRTKFECMPAAFLWPTESNEVFRKLFFLKMHSILCVKFRPCYFDICMSYVWRPHVPGVGV